MSSCVRTAMAAGESSSRVSFLLTDVTLMLTRSSSESSFDGLFVSAAQAPATKVNAAAPTSNLRPATCNLQRATCDPLPNFLPLPVGQGEGRGEGFRVSGSTQLALCNLLESLLSFTCISLKSNDSLACLAAMSARVHTLELSRCLNRE